MGDRRTTPGLGLLVAGGAAAPTALAEDPTDPEAADAIPEAPDPAVAVLVATPGPSAGVSGPLNASFGTGKAFDLALTVDGTAPADLDLAGATFAFTQSGAGAPAATCTTTSGGTCTVSSGGTASSTGSAVALADGTYTVTQLDAVDGLVPVDGVVGTFTMNSSAITFGPGGPFVPGGMVPIRQAVQVRNVSEYSPQVVASVVDADTGDVLPGAAFTLSGAVDYPAVTAPSLEAALVDPQVPSSDGDGVLTFDGWFLPGDLTLTPVRVPDGYVLGAPLTLTVPSTPGLHAPDAWALADLLEVARIAPPVVDAPPVVSGPPATPSPAPSPTPAPAPTPSRTSTAPRPAAVVPPAPPAPAVGTQVEDTVPPAAATTTPPPAAAAATPWPRESRFTATDGPLLAEGTELQTASSSVPGWSVMAAGVLFVAVVIGGATFVRRRVRG